ncbi:AMP binding protein [Mycena maculata]|uniref:AMP binding protein n=1 Tax=Mycena maculata TaxID=230809 RepID=A0AAD7I410_9AGAR|nr:AMP binding protein [Mycena maculata]
MTPRIYTSHVPDVPILNTSIFTRLFAPRASGDIGGFSASLKVIWRYLSPTEFATTTRPSAKKGDTVLIYSPNSLAWPVALYGSVAAGLRCTFANSAYTSHELGYQYQDSGAKLVLTAEEGLRTVREMFAGLSLSKEDSDKRIVVLENNLRWAGGPASKTFPDACGLVILGDLLSRSALKLEEKFEGSAANETVYLCYSSGTTGKPKGVETTHQNMTTMVDIVSGFPPLIPGEQPMLGILPFYHIYSVSNLLNYLFTVGCPVIIQTRFEPVEFCANIEKYKVVFAFLIPPVFVVLTRHPAIDKYDLSSLEYMLSGAAPLGADLVKMVQQRLLSKRNPGGKCCITQGYGLTETSPSTHMLEFHDADRKIGSVGHLLPNLKVHLVEDADGQVDAQEGQPGELWIHSPSGYLNNVSATKNAITPDGWFKTGDVAIRDKEGHYYIVERVKELIKYKGFQVPPAELEALLFTHPEIADAAVIGVESIEQVTELPRAYVIHAHPEQVNSAQAKAVFANSIVKWIETKVAKHKFLRGGVGVIDVVPKSAAGKILRRELRDLAKQEVARGEINTGFKARLQFTRLLV